MQQQANIIGIIEDKNFRSDDGAMVLTLKYLNPNHDELEFFETLKVIVPQGEFASACLNPGQPIAATINFIYDQADGCFLGAALPGTLKVIDLTDLVLAVVLDYIIMKDLPSTLMVTQPVQNAILYRLGSRFGK